MESPQPPDLELSSSPKPPVLELGEIKSPQPPILDIAIGSTAEEQDNKKTTEDEPVVQISSEVDPSNEEGENGDAPETIQEEQKQDNANNGNDIAISKEQADESDGEIHDSDNETEPSSDIPVPAKPVVKEDFGVLAEVRPELDQLDYDEDVDEEGEIVDEPSTKQEKDEMSDGEIESSDGEVHSGGENKDKKIVPTQGFYPDDFEEGEMVDPIEGPAIPREVCRFFLRGNCTWGDRCRFVHPGINDKGGYNMFADEMKSSAPEPRPPQPPPMEPQNHGAVPGFPALPPAPETAWDRGLREAKEMRRRAMQRKVEEPDFMRKREIISCNEALNIDRDMDYIAQKPLVDDAHGYDPLGVFDEDDRYAVPAPEELKRIKRFESMKISHHKDDNRRPSPRRDVDMRRGGSPRRVGKDRHLPPPGHPMHMHERRSPPRNLPPHHRGPPPPLSQMPPRFGEPDFRDQAPRDRDYRDRRMEDGMRDRGYPPRYDGRPHEARRIPSPKREVESRIVPVGKKSDNEQGIPGRGDVWSDPWARGRQQVKGRQSRSSSGSSGSSSSASRSSSSSRSRSSSSGSSSSGSSSGSSSDSSRSPSPKKTTKKLTKKSSTPATKVAAITKQAKGSPKLTKPSVVKKSNQPLLEEVNKNGKPPVAVKPPTKVGEAPERGRAATKIKTKQRSRKKSGSSSSSSEFSRSSSSESGSKERSDSESESDSGSSTSSSGSGSSSSSDSSDSSDEEMKSKAKKMKITKTVAGLPQVGTGEQAVGKVSVPSKPGRKDVKMTIINKPQQKSGTQATDNRKRSAAAMSSGTKSGGKKVSAIANRRVELLEQLKVVENAILKKRAKLT